MNRQFSLGQVVATPGALRCLAAAGVAPLEVIARHNNGDWGDLRDEDKQLNNEALRNGSRILSKYTLATGDEIYIITEAEDNHGYRSATTILRTSEY